MADHELVRVQEKGQVTLPAEWRCKLGLKKGDLVAIVETSEGVLITPQQVLAARTLDQIGAILAQQGLTLEDFLESGREEREDLIREQYGIDPNQQPDK